MKNNYPIKYVAMPIIEQTGWYPGLNELEREYGVVCYITSKCYLVGKEEEYDRCGETICKYKVVIPYKKDTGNQYLYRVEPSYCLMDGRCNNSIDVDRVFDNFDEAKKETDKKNEEIVKKKIRYLHCDDNFLQNVALLREEQKKKVNRYKKIERKMERNSSDLVVNAEVKEQTIIFKRDNRFTLNEYSLYIMVRFYTNVDFVVYNVSLDEYQQMIEQIRNNEQIDLANIKKNCLLINNHNDKKVKIINYDSIDKKSYFYIKDDNLYYDDKMTYSLDNLSNDTVIVYTVETYDDVISSYISNFVINKEMPKNEDTEKVFRKRIKLR